MTIIDELTDPERELAFAAHAVRAERWRAIFDEEGARLVYDAALHLVVGRLCRGEEVEGNVARHLAARIAESFARFDFDDLALLRRLAGLRGEVALHERQIGLLIEEARDARWRADESRLESAVERIDADPSLGALRDRAAKQVDAA